MASITIRDLEPELKERLRVRAARRRRSMEEEARVILRAAIAESAMPPMRLADSIRRRFRGTGIDLQLPAREATRRPPALR